MYFDCVPVTHELKFMNSIPEHECQATRLVAGSLTAECVFDSGLVCIGFAVEKVTIKQGFLRLIEFSPFSNTLPTLRFPSACCSYQQDMEAKPRNLPIK